MAASAKGDPEPAGAAGILAMLRAQGGRATEPRRVIIEVLISDGRHNHLSAERVVGEVRQRLPGVAESTVYRTLAALEELGVVTHVHLGHGPSTYHLTGDSHRHLVCETCDTIIEVPGYEFALLATHLSNTYGFELTNEHFALAGTCAECSTTPRSGRHPGR